jgi:hypothetical protein
MCDIVESCYMTILQGACNWLYNNSSASCDFSVGGACSTSQAQRGGGIGLIGGGNSTPDRLGGRLFHPEVSNFINAVPPKFKPA